ncbi:MAG: ComEC/Rec2 family competence protein [Oscillospiraceae bacterium]|jgi:competence protein ComEC|nr:ComEC/Rec2 family competence protein [Oscillospiraceae bacterium]
MAERPLALIGLAAFICLFLLGGASSLLPAWLVLALSVPSAALAFFLIRKTGKKRLFAIAAAIVISCSAFSLLFIVHTKTDYQNALSAVSQNSVIKAKIISNSEESDGRYYYILKTSEIGSSHLGAKIRYLSHEKLDYEPYTTLVINAKEIYSLGGTEPVWQIAWKADGVFIGAYGDIQSAAPPEQKSPFYYILKLQVYITEIVMQTLPSQPGAVLLGFLIGNVDFIDNATYASTKITGITHLFSVSGLHVSLWSLFLASLLKKTGLNVRVRSLLCIGFVVFLVTLTGFTPSAARAGIMMLLVFVGELIFKETDSLNSLGFAMIVLLLITPFSARSISLILSFFAALGILLIAPKAEQYLEKRTDRWRSKPCKRAVRLVSPSLCISLGVTLATLPWMVYSFGAFSVIAPIVNLLVVLPSSAAMVLTGLAVLSSPVEFLFYPVITLAGLIAKYILEVAALLAKVPGALIKVEPFLLVFSLAAAMLAAWIFYKNKKTAHFFRPAYGLFALILIVSNLAYTLVPTSRVTLTVPSIGNGSALIVSQNNKSALLACGGSPRNTVFALTSQNIYRLDFLLIPRAQPTESSAAEQILNDYSPAAVLASEELLPQKSVFDEAIRFADTANETILETISLTYQNSAGFSAILLKCNGKKILVTFLPASDFSAMPSEWKSADLLIARAAVPESLDPSRFGAIIVSTAAQAAPLPQNAVSTALHGAVRIDIAKNGTIKLSFGE